jgi:hypothetical protein
MIVVEYVPAFSTETETASPGGIVCVGPGWVDPPALVVCAVVETTIVAIGVGGTVCVGVVCPPPMVHPAVKMTTIKTVMTEIVSMIFMNRDSVPDYMRILFGASASCL